MQTIYYVIFKNKSIPEPYIYLSMENRLDQESLKKYDDIIYSFTTHKFINLHQKIFVVFDEIDRIIIDIFFDENIPVSLKKEYVYTTIVHDNVFGICHK